MTDYRKILDFWFNELNSFKEKIKLWFGGAKETDERIRMLFEKDVIAASKGKLDDWEKEPESCLALVILLDQFSLNIYRNKARSFEINSLALPISLRAIDKKFDKYVKPIQRVFFYLPLEHAEDLKIQNQSVSLFQKLYNEAAVSEKDAMKTFLDYAVMHREVIERFNRFPDRNDILGRTPTPEEKEYMDQGGPPF